MKKLFLFVAVGVFAFSLNSCSSSDGGSATIGGTITMKVNGVAKTFNTVVVNEQVYEAGTVDEYTELTMTGAIGTSTNEIILMRLDKGDVGASAIYECFYTKDGVEYNAGLTSNVTTNNTSKKLIGNFSGGASDGTTTFTFTEGAFNVQY
jgi:hypothetical protein